MTPPDRETVTDIPGLLSRWAEPDGHPYKGSLIDPAAYADDPSDIGCMCAQGQALHLLGGWTPERLMNAKQREADTATMAIFGISRAHAVLLRNVNDTADGAPGIVITAPERVLGDQAHVVLAFWRHLDRMTAEQWGAARAAARAAAGDAAGAAAWDAAWAAAWDAAWAAARAAAGDAAGDAASASNEIQGAALMRERGQPFYFLPFFGFADPGAVMIADALARTERTS